MTNIILILGNSNHEIMNRRLNRGIEEFNKLKNPYEDEEFVYGINTLILLSGNGKNIKINDKVYEREVSYMYEYVSHKVNKKYILIENEEMNLKVENINFSERKIDFSEGKITSCTVKNLINSYNLLKNLYKDSFFNRINITICTSTFHLKRTIILSKILNKDNFTLKYIHTNEIISEEENRKELKHLDNFMNYYCNNL